MADTSAPTANTPLVDISNLLAAMGVPSERQTEDAATGVETASTAGTTTANAAAGKGVFRKNATSVTAGITPEQYGVMAGQATEVAVSLARQGADASAAIVKSIQDAGFINKDGETAGMITSKKLAELKIQERMQAIAQATNVDQLQIVLGQDLAALTMRQRELHDKIIKDSSVSLFDKPLTAIGNAFTLPWDQQALSAVMKKVDDSTKISNDLATHVTNAAKTALATQQTLTVGLIEEQATKMAALANVNVQEARLKAISSNSAALVTVMRMNDAQLNAHHVQVQERNDEERLKLARAADARSAAEWTQKKKIFDETEEAQKGYLALINAGRAAAFNLPAIDMATMRRYRTAGGDTQKLMDDWAQRGFVALNSPNKMASSGETPAERLYNGDRSGIAPDPNVPAQGIMRDMQVKSWTDAAALNKGAPKELIAQEAQKLFEADVKKMASNIKASDSMNPFQAPTYATMELSLVGQSDMWKKYVLPSIGTSEAARKLPVDPQKIFEAMKAAVASNDPARPSPNTAMNFMASVFQQAAATNNVMSDSFRRAGIEQSSYNTTIKLGMFNTVPVNAMNSTQLKNTLAKALVSDVVNVGMMSSGFEFFGGGAVTEQQKQMDNMLEAAKEIRDAKK